MKENFNRCFMCGSVCNRLSNYRWADGSISYVHEKCEPLMVKRAKEKFGYEMELVLGI